MNTKCALIVIDMQNGFINERSAQCIRGARATVPACARVIGHCRESGVPVFFVSRRYRADGSDVEHTRFQSWLAGGKALSDGCAEDISADAPAEFGVCDRDYFLIKPRYSAFFHTELDRILRRLGISTVVLVGTTTPNCVRTTCYDGISLEYNVVVLSDCTSSQTEEIQQGNLRDMQNVGAQIMTAEEFISGMKLADTAAETRKAVLEGV
ncbi:MAG: cysteine hydrolase [Oscillospiraceae bacterium]|nr:cysteine hydrolase [Oscillospiraceae bacterium]